MLKLDVGGGGSGGRRQCAYCVVRQSGLCSVFGDAELDATGLEAAHLPVRVFNPGDCIYSQGEGSDLVFNLVSGWIGLHQDMSDGRRQISQFLLPGALFGVKPKGARRSHGATAITAASVCAIPTQRLDELRRDHPGLNEQFIWMLQRENHVSQQALTIIGQGASPERVAHILWDLAVRICAPSAVAPGAVLKAPLTQRLIAEATGLTAIHVNRVVRRLREQKVVDFHDGVMTIEDPDRLAALADAGPELASCWDIGAGAPDLPVIASPQPQSVAAHDPVNDARETRA